MSTPITAIWALAVLGMGVLLVMQPQSSVSRWQGRSTAGPSHYLWLPVLLFWMFVVGASYVVWLL